MEKLLPQPLTRGGVFPYDTACGVGQEQGSGPVLWLFSLSVGIYRIGILFFKLFLE